MDRLTDPDKPEITNYKHQMPNKFQISISKSQIGSNANRLVRLRRIGHCDFPFELAQGGGELVEPFGICVLLFEFF